MNSYTTETFIKKAIDVHGNIYDYSNVIYKNNKEKVIIFCKLHGPFSQIPRSHLDGNGCKKCFYEKYSIDKTITQKEFLVRVKNIHGKTYDYSKVNYRGKKYKVEIICPIHGSFIQSPRSHLYGIGCPSCKTSKGERLIEVFLTEHKISFERQKTFSDCKGPNKGFLRFDFFVPTKNIIIEFDGQQHYNSSCKVGKYITTGEDFQYIQQCDKIKNEYANQKTMVLLRIPYWKIKNISAILSEYILPI